MTETHVHIGQVADVTGMSHRTIRYYEEMGLVTPTARTDGGFRLYDDADIDRLLLIKPMKPLGFTLEQMRQLLTALDTLGDATTSTADRSAAQAQISEIHGDALARVTELRKATAAAETFTQRLTHEMSTPESRPS